MTMISMRFDNDFNLIKTESPFVSRFFDEVFDGDKLAVLCENSIPLDNLRRKEARHQVILEKYLNQSFELRNFSVFKNCHRTSYEQNQELCTRVQAQSSSAQGMLRESRHFIFNESYFDIDMANAHPRIVLKLCRELGFDCPALTEYVASREHILEMCQKSGESREHYKKLFLSLMYGKKIDLNSENDFVGKFALEFKSLSKKITDAFPSFKEECIALRKRNGKDYNHDAACLSHLCQCFESKFLDIMFEILLLRSPKHANKSIPCFDGLMIYKGSFNEMFTPDDFIRECEAVVGLPDVFRLEKKSMQDMHDTVERAYDYSCENPGEHIERYLKSQRLLKIRSYKNLKNTQSQTFKHEPQTNIIDFVHNMLSEYKVWPDSEILEAYFAAHCNRYLANIASSPGTLTCNVSKQIVREQKLPNAVIKIHKNLGVFETTLQNLVMNTNLINTVNHYSSLGCYPYSTVSPPRCPEGEFNTFVGLKASYKKLGGTSRNLEIVLKHMLDVLSNGDEKVLDYLLLWFQTIFRNPGSPSKRCLIFTSRKQQIGKGIFLNWVVSNVFGKPYGNVRKNAEFLDKGFNKEFEMSILNVMDEVPQLNDLTDGHRQANAFKSYITEPFFEIIEKGKTPVQRHNCNNFIITSNDKCPVYINPDDVRFFKVACGEMYWMNFDYFDKLLEIFKIQETADDFYSYCFDYESKFNQHVHRQPQTAALLESKQFCTQNSIKFITYIHGLISDGLLCNGKSFDEEYLTDDILGDLINNYTDVKGKVRISSKHLYPVFEKWAKAEGIKKIVKKSTFMEEIESADFINLVNLSRVHHALISRD